MAKRAKPDPNFSIVRDNLTAVRQRMAGGEKPTAIADWLRVADVLLFR
jgi:hypothetical protein